MDKLVLLKVILHKSGNDYFSSVDLINTLSREIHLFIYLFFIDFIIFVSSEIILCMLVFMHRHCQMLSRCSMLQE